MQHLLVIMFGWIFFEATKHVNDISKRGVSKKKNKGKKCRNPTLRECEDETHTPKMGTWESSWTPKISEFNCKD
jgi:hypothetical protein